MKDIKWVVQRNLHDIENFEHALRNLQYPVEWVTVVPFSPTIPSHTVDTDDCVNVYYGSTSFIWNLYNQLNPIGVFYDPELFCMRNYVSKWGVENMLSDDPTFCTMGELLDMDILPNVELFIRPDGDTKSFPGEVLKFADIAKWIDAIVIDDFVGVNVDTPIMINAPYAIKKEWRNQIVNGQIVTSSRYRENHILSVSAHDIPADMIEFVLRMVSIYQPHPIFTMDVALTNDGYSIIECGNSNSVGLYDMKTEIFIDSISKAVASW